MIRRIWPSRTRFMYSDVFRKRRFWSGEAWKDLTLLDRLLSEGFQYVYPLERAWQQSLRSPTVGVMVEVSVLPTCAEAVKLNSIAGRVLLSKRAYPR